MAKGPSILFKYVEVILQCVQKTETIFVTDSYNMNIKTTKIFKFLCGQLCHFFCNCQQAWFGCYHHCNAQLYDIVFLLRPGIVFVLLNFYWHSISVVQLFSIVFLLSSYLAQYFCCSVIRHSTVFLLSTYPADYFCCPVIRHSISVAQLQYPAQYFCCPVIWHSISVFQLFSILFLLSSYST